MRKFMVSLSELAWAAGFFDGEGSTFTLISRYGTRTHGLSVAQSYDPVTLHRFNAAIGDLGKVRGPYQYGNPKCGPKYTCAVNSFERVQAVVALLWRFLSPPKREQAHLALSQLPAVNPWDRQSCPAGHLYTPENTAVYARSRNCKQCVRERAREYSRKKHGWVRRYKPREAAYA